MYKRQLRVGPTLGGGVEPGRADSACPSPRPAQRVIFSKSRAQARPGLSVIFQSHATSARPGQRVSNPTGRLPGLARVILRIFSLFLRVVSPRPRHLCCIAHKKKLKKRFSGQIHDWKHLYLCFSYVRRSVIRHNSGVTTNKKSTTLG